LVVLCFKGGVLVGGVCVVLDFRMGDAVALRVVVDILVDAIWGVGYEYVGFELFGDFLVVFVVECYGFVLVVGVYLVMIFLVMIFVVLWCGMRVYRVRVGYSW